MLSTKSTKTACRCGGKTICESACLGLEKMERPRFFSGQLLTESDLNSLERYILDKNRLHNLHQHGWGVACGLEVVCHPDCSGWVTLKPGYAIDACGNDIVVSEEEHIDVLGRIRECKEARRKGPRDCRRLDRRDVPPEKQREEHWCITLSYQELETRVTTAMRRDSGSGCAAGCGCGGSCACGDHRRGSSKSSHSSSHEGACGCGGSGVSTRPATRTRGIVDGCEPTRIEECFRIDLCESDGESCCFQMVSSERLWADKFSACVENLKDTFSRSPKGSFKLLGGLMLDDVGIKNGLFDGAERRDVAGMQAAYCEVYDYIADLYRDSPGVLHCSILDKLKELRCPTPRVDETTDSFRQVLVRPARDLGGLLFAYLIDCLCHAALPPCAACCPDEDELIVACVTVRDGQIQEICNYSCRRWAGVFPPSMMGVYLGPLMPIAGKLLSLLCCGDVFEKLFRLVGKNSWAKASAESVAADEFALPKQFAEIVNEEALSLFLDGPKDKIHVASVTGMTEDQAAVALEVKGVPATFEHIEDVSILDRLGALRLFTKGEHVTAYVNDGKVVGFARTRGKSATIIRQGKELAALRVDLATVRESLNLK